MLAFAPSGGRGSCRAKVPHEDILSSFPSSSLGTDNREAPASLNCDRWLRSKAAGTYYYNTNYGYECRQSMFVNALATLVVCLGPVLAAEPTPISPDKTIPLFNGKDLDHFTPWLKETKENDTNRVFRVTDEMIHVTGEGFGYIATKQAYRDYRLTLEYKWGKKTDGGKYVRNSGVLLHGTGPDGAAGGVWMASIECQLAQGCNGDLICIRGKDAAGTVIPVQITSDTILGPDKRPRWSPGGEKKVFTGRQLWWNKHDPDFQELLDTRGKNDVESPLGEWTNVELLCRGAKIQVKINEQLVNEAYEVFPAAGKILLQSEGFEIYFRKVEIHPLPAE